MWCRANVFASGREQGLVRADLGDFGTAPLLLGDGPAENETAGIQSERDELEGALVTDFRVTLEVDRWEYAQIPPWCRRVRRLPH